MNRPTPKLAITIGDPAGIGPEICLKLLTDASAIDGCVPILFGDETALLQAADCLNNKPAKEKLASLRRISFNDASPDSLDQQLQQLSSPALVDFGSEGLDRINLGEVSAVAGEASCQYIFTAIDCCLRGTVDAVVTGPINKLAIHAAGYHYPGHTEILAARTRSESYCMMQVCDEVTCSFVTTHIGYQQVLKQLSIERIGEVIEISARAIKRIRGREPKLVVCGLNPHAGEDGLFGEGEEERLIRPAIEQAAAAGIQIEGPLPPDTCFIPTRRKQTDCFVCMYHDQGHIPLKALAFDRAVNVTLGLPIVRTSVDHGTAFEIVGKGVANPGSLIQAVRLAMLLVENRSDSSSIRDHVSN